jgi:hypothetical protein
MQRWCGRIGRVAAGLVALVLLAAAELPPTCEPPADGLQVCMEQQVCTCRYDPAGSLTGRVAGWRWQCEMMQMCQTERPAGLESPSTSPPLGPFYIAPNIQSPSQQPSGPTQQPTPTPMPTPPLLRRP